LKERIPRRRWKYPKLVEHIVEEQEGIRPKFPRERKVIWTPLEEKNSDERKLGGKKQSSPQWSRRYQLKIQKARLAHIQDID